MSVEFIDNSEEVKSAMRNALLRGLEIVGQTCEKYAAMLCSGFKNSKGKLRDSITHRVDEEEEVVYVGSNLEYAAYVELGTGKYYPGGRPTPWAYQDENGDWHWTHGNKAHPFLKPAAEDHKPEYQKILEDELKNG